MVNKVDHIGLAVRSIDASLVFFRDLLGLKLLHRERVEEQGVEVAFLEAGETTLELLEPLAPDTPVGRFLARNGEGVHHVALGVDDLEAARQRVATGDVRLLSERPINGAHGKLITFLHPKDSHGILVELCRRRDDER